MATTPIPDNSALEPNSHKYHEEKSRANKEKAEKIVQGGANKRKKPMSKQVKEALVGDVEEVRSYLLWDVLVPAIKDTMVDLIKAFAEGIFHSNGSRSSNKYVQRNGPTSYVSYSSYSNQRGPRPGDRRDVYSGRTQRGYYNRAYDYDSIVYDRREDAEAVLDALAARTMEYGVACVADLYELSGIRSSYTDMDYGWAELTSASVERVRDGYVINLPKPERLD